MQQPVPFDTFPPDHFLSGLELTEQSLCSRSTDPCHRLPLPSKFSRDFALGEHPNRWALVGALAAQLWQRSTKKISAKIRKKGLPKACLPCSSRWPCRKTRRHRWSRSKDLIGRCKIWEKLTRRPVQTVSGSTTFWIKSKTLSVSSSIIFLQASCSGHLKQA